MHELTIPAATAAAILEKTAEAAYDFARGSRAAATLRAYQSDWRSFTRFCATTGLDPLPATPATVALYLTHLAGAGLRPSSLGRHQAAIRFVHRSAGHSVPKSDALGATVSGIKRHFGVAPIYRKAPLTAELVGAMVEGMEGLHGIRDRALIVLGFAGAFRRSELVALNVDDLEEKPEGILVHIRFSKTDQEGQGQLVSIPHGATLKPVQAVKAWLEVSEIAEGPIFRAINRGGVILPARLSSHAVAIVIKRRAQEVGLDPVIFSGHSLRSGFVTSALEHDADKFRIMDQTRHKDLKTLRVYDRRAKAFKGHAGDGFL